MHSLQNDGLFDCRPILCVASVNRSIAYYVDALGFRLGWASSEQEQRFLQFGDEAAPTFALVGRGPVQFMLSENSQGAPGMWLHLEVHSAGQLDGLHAEWAGRKAIIVEAPALRPWGMYEMRVRSGRARAAGIIAAKLTVTPVWPPCNRLVLDQTNR